MPAVRLLWIAGLAVTCRIGGTDGNTNPARDPLGRDRKQDAPGNRRKRGVSGASVAPPSCRIRGKLAIFKVTYRHPSASISERALAVR